MKKIIVGMFAFAFLLLGATAYASGPFNGQAGDCSPTIGIGNYTDGNIPRDTYGCWTSSSISGGDGDTINVGFYYHNNTNSTLSNVRGVISRSSSGSSRTHTFTGSMTSDQGNTPLGTVSLNLSNSQTLTYVSTHLMKGEDAVLADRDTSVGYSESSMNVGSVPPGWKDYGTIIFVYKVGTTDDDNDDPINYDCSIDKFTIDGDTGTVYIDEDESARIVWDTEDCDSVRVSGPDFSSSAKSDSETIYPEDGTYTITARGDNGTVSRTIRVRIEENNNNDDNCVINNFRVNGSSTASVTSGQLATLSWNTTGCDYVNIPGIGGNLPASYSHSVYPTYSTTYILNAYSYNGNTRNSTVRVNVNNIVIPPTPTPVVNNCAITGVVTNITQNSATLNGIVSSGTGVSYFEYGPSTNLGYQTTSRTSSGIYADSITGLVSNTTYFYRFVSNCGGTLSYGKMDVFRTQGTATVVNTRTIIQGTTVIGTSSPIMLTIENRYQSIAIGDIMDYTVTYKNIGKSILTNPLVQVVVPEGIVITNSSAGTYSRETNTLNVPINDLHPGQEGVIYLQARVDNISSLNAQIVTTAILVYTSPSGAQENAIAYVLNSPKEIFQSNTLGASAFWSGIWGMGLIGWLLLLILILLIILITRRYSTSKTVVHNNNTHPNVPTPHY